MQRSHRVELMTSALSATLVLALILLSVFAPDALAAR
jgi:hypothetical protein